MSMLSSKLMNAILSMDSYNRDYDSAINLGEKDENENCNVG